jgi:hypothetical protein
VSQTIDTLPERLPIEVERRFVVDRVVCALKDVPDRLPHELSRRTLDQRVLLYEHMFARVD